MGYCKEEGIRIMRVIVGCECSGTVRDAFAALGHDAWSCDLKPSKGKHLQCDVLTILNRGWDLGIFHPDCTYLTISAAWAFKDGPFHQKLKPGTLTGAARRKARDNAVEFVKTIWNCSIPKVAIENPVGFLSSMFRKPSQIIQPYEFYDDASKFTCLWLRGLPLLRPTKRFPGRKVEWPRGSGKIVERWSNQTDGGQNKLPPSETRAADRAVTYPGFAAAMAAQWSKP